MNLYSASLIAHLATLSNDWLKDSQ